MESNSAPLPETTAPSGQNLEVADQTGDIRGGFPLKALLLGVILLILVTVPGLIFLYRQKAQEKSTEEIAAALSQPNRRAVPFISCPLAKEQCLAGQPVIEEAEEGEVYSVRFVRLGGGSAVLASVGGEMTAPSGNSFLITDEQRGIQLRYVTEGEFVFEDEGVFFYEEKGPIGTFGGGENTLTVYAKSMNTGEPIHLGIGAGGEFLTNLE